MLLVVTVLTAMCMTGAIARADDFPTGSMMLGDPVLHSEDDMTDGTVTSTVPPVQDAADHELVVIFSADADADQETTALTNAGVQLVGALPHMPADLVRVSGSDDSPAIASLRADPNVVDVQDDTVDTEDHVNCGLVSSCVIPDDPLFSSQWDLYNGPGVAQPPGSPALLAGADIDAPLAWHVTLGSPSVTIAIIDSGIDMAQPDLASKIVAAANFTDASTVDDDAGHGTHVAGIAAATFNNGVGITGVAPSARLMNVKVLALDSNGEATGDCADIADGIVWATDHGANILNLSLGTYTPCDAIGMAVSYAFAHGALVVAAAGNDATSQPFYPAAYPNVLSVGATDDQDQPATFTNHDPSWVKVAAPGVAIPSTLPTYDNGTGVLDYGYMSGTSMSAPIVSGIAALIWAEMPPGQTNLEVENRILATTEQNPGTGIDWKYGRVDACLAVTNDDHAACSPQPNLAPIVAPPSQKAPTTAAPVAAQARAAATPGSYHGALTQRGSTLGLTVDPSGNQLTNLQARLNLSCHARQTRTIRVSQLSVAHYGKINPNGRFTFTLTLTATSPGLHAQRITVSGHFNPSRGQANGTFRITARAPAPAVQCDSHHLHWSARVTPTH